MLLLSLATCGGEPPQQTANRASAPDLRVENGRTLAQPAVAETTGTQSVDPAVAPAPDSVQRAIEAFADDSLAPLEKVLDASGADTLWATELEVVWTRSDGDGRREVTTLDVGYSPYDAGFENINADTLVDVFLIYYFDPMFVALLLGREHGAEIVFGRSSCDIPRLRDFSGDGLLDIVNPEGGVGLLDDWCNSGFYSDCYDDFPVSWPAYYVQVDGTFQLDTITTAGLYGPLVEEYQRTRAEIEAAWTSGDEEFGDWCNVPAMLASLDSLAARAKRISSSAPEGPPEVKR